MAFNNNPVPIIKIFNEIIEYKGESYKILNFPLKPFLDNRKDIKFDPVSLSNVGYHGFWKLEDNRLFIKSIHSSNHDLKSIFNTTLPVFANWFTGIIEMGFGETFILDSKIQYEYYLWLKIENGIVIDREITRKFDTDFQIEFGKYKGRTFFEVLYGKINRIGDTNQLIKEFINEIAKFFCSADFKREINIPANLKLLIEIKRILLDVGFTSINFLLTDKFLALEKYTHLIDTLEDVDNISVLIEKILKFDFKHFYTMKRKDNPDNIINDKTLLINPDFSFLEKSINEFEDFVIPPHYYHLNLSYKYLNNFSITRLNSTIFEYSPNIDFKIFNLPVETGRLNTIKFQNKNNVIFDAENNIYLLNRSRTYIFEKFRKFLNKEYLDKDCENEDDINDSIENQQFEDAFYDDGDDTERDYFNAMTDGQLGDYDDFLNNGGDIDEIETWSRG